MATARQVHDGGRPRPRKGPSRRRAFDSGPAAARHRPANIRDPLKYAVPRAGSARRAGAAERPGAAASPAQTEGLGIARFDGRTLTRYKSDCMRNHNCRVAAMPKARRPSELPRGN
ncbi:unnamed protein product, partial [Ixodes pacificus]